MEKLFLSKSLVLPKFNSFDLQARFTRKIDRFRLALVTFQKFKKFESFNR